jgi:hypothetical protein
MKYIRDDSYPDHGFLSSWQCDIESRSGSYLYMIKFLYIYFNNLRSAIIQGNVPLVTELIAEGLKDHSDSLCNKPLLFMAVDHDQPQIVGLLT